MRKTALTVALAAGALVPLAGTAHALDGANTFGKTNGTSTIVTTNPAFTCNPAAPTKPSDALCRVKLSGTHSETNAAFGKTHGTYSSKKVTLDYSYAAVSHTACASVSGSLTLQISNASNQAIGSTTITLTPASASNPNGSKACNTGGQTPTDSDVSTLYLVGPITGNIGGFPACGSSESKGSSVRNRNSSGALTGVSRDTSNLQAILNVGEACTSTS